VVNPPWAELTREGGSGRFTDQRKLRPAARNQKRARLTVMEGGLKRYTGNDGKDNRDACLFNMAHS